jgi:hypothetical protein
MGSSWFLLLILLKRQICNNTYRDRASALNKTFCTLTRYLLTIKLVPRHLQNKCNLYPDGKNHAIASLHRDTILAKVPGHCPVTASANAH